MANFGPLTALPIFGRAAITLGIGPHSSLVMQYVGFDDIVLCSPHNVRSLVAFLLLLNICEYVCRRLTTQQKALILAYAETETGVDGTVNGIASTKDGMILPLICCSHIFTYLLCWVFAFGALTLLVGRPEERPCPGQISSKSLKPRPRYGDFSDFCKMAAVRHLEFVMRLFGPRQKGI